MISGSITLYEEETQFKNHYQGQWYGEDWELYRSSLGDVSRQKTWKDKANDAIDAEIEYALKQGFHIGQQVRRRVGDRNSIGIVKHFVRDIHRAYNSFTNEADVIAVQWPSWNTTHNYTTNDLELVVDTNPLVTEY